MASSFIVIKVKYGETLQRFRASIIEKKLVLDIVTLREKIRGFFGFGSGIEFTLTYIDEDGDAVILAGDDDLYDIVLQSLNPLRINVKLDNGNILGGSSGTFAPSRLPQNMFPCQNLNTGLLHTLNSSSLPQSQSQTINASVSQTLNLSSPVQPQSQTTNASVSQTLLLNRLQSFRAKFPQTLNSPTDQMNTRVLHTLNSSSLPQPQSQTINASVSQTLNLSSPVQPQTQTINSSVDQTLNSSSLLPNRLQSLRTWVPQTLTSPSNQMNTGATSSASGVARFVEKMKDTYVNPTFTFMAGGGASNVDGQHGANSKSSTVKDSKVQVNREGKNINSNKKEKQVKKVNEGVRFNFPHFEFKPFSDPFNATKGLKDTAPKPPRSNLDSEFLCHVTVPDGTIMAPNTKFTKIWKMMNLGAIPWPQGSQLKWVWGDRLSSSSCVDIEIPTDGLPVNKDLDIAVDFTAPGLPGRYISCWRMASPSGHKFGNQVWVKIQVETSMKDLGEASTKVNLSPVLQNPEVVNQDHLIDSGNNTMVSDSEGANVDSQSKDQEKSCPVDESLIVDNGDGSNIVATPISSVNNSTRVKTPLASLTGSEATPAMGSAAPSSLPVVAAQPLDSASQKTSLDQEQGRLKDLEVKGFKQQDLKKDVLKTNNYDLEKSLDDLCSDSEDWDPMLDELQELGFADDETKSKLLLSAKNNGAIDQACSHESLRLRESLAE